MDRTEEMLVDLMDNLDVELLEGNYMESDLKRGRTAWLTTFVKERNWRKDSEKDGVQAQGMQEVRAMKEKKRARRKRIERTPLSYEWGEAIRTDMGKRLHESMRKMKRRAAAVWGFVSGVVTMAVIALSFVAIIGKKKGAEL